MNGLRRVRRLGQRGAVTVEFAMVLVPMLALLTGGVEFGYYAYSQSVLRSSMREVARMAATGEHSISDLNATVRERLARVRIPANQVTTVAKSYSQFGDQYSKAEPITHDNEPLGGSPGSGDCFLDFDKNGAWSAETTGGADDVLYYEVTARHRFMFGFMGSMLGTRNRTPTGEPGDSKWFGSTDGTLLMKANTTIRNEPFSNPPETCIP